eukprot:1157220-Pelagomonas_calceolata.AAC.4
MSYYNVYDARMRAYVKVPTHTHIHVFTALAKICNARTHVCTHTFAARTPLLAWTAELRKDKAERAPGGVTPGNNPAYHAAVERAHQPDGAMAGGARDRSPLRDVKLNRVRPPTPPTLEPPQLCPVARVLDPEPASQVLHKDCSKRGINKVNAVPISGDLEYDDDEEMSRHEDLMDTILEEEEQLITAHRMQVCCAAGGEHA